MSKVCLVSYFAWPVLSGEPVPGVSPGGEEVQHSLLARVLARRGADAALVTGDFGQAQETRIENVRVLKTFRADAGLPVLRMIYPRLTTLWQALTTADADTYYVSCAGSIVGYVAAFCARHKRRFVFRVASDADCCPDRLLVSNARDRWLYEWGIRKASCILVQTRHQQTLLKTNYGLDSEIADMLVDIPDQPAPQASRDIDVLWLANLRSVKRPEWVIELARSLPQVKFVMAGGPYTNQSELFDTTKKEASQLPNLDFLGSIPHRETGQLFSRAKLFLNTSELEGFPNTYLQAWANGTPVVATFDPDGLIKKKHLGSACVTQNETALALQGLLHDTTTRLAVGLRAHAFVNERFGAPAVSSYENHLFKTHGHNSDQPTQSAP
ncbi:glycosyltransferase family 4 protein [Dechloromonas denitrificans]|uniref:glycosyltransferase family 4 protein n=1 Tax=Dechloromonas denitrificans TaxID=281362 RepID=UPI001CF8013D|nr:glycosyltransferase family 4 protein [Dechloromonas denitrificans]UCV05493.1 glycosyltransferase family 4 protein [Dechloromonas denitrificans]UCV09839.1 glycosyltransferase family 4 protein [Dechloromonas denitrificans]